MTNHDPVLLVLPRRSWDALVGATDPTVRRALDSLVQVDTCLHAAIRTLDGVVEDVVASIHLDAADAIAGRWARECRASGDAEVVVRSVPVGLTRTGEAQ